MQGYSCRFILGQNLRKFRSWQNRDEHQLKSAKPKQGRGKGFQEEPSQQIFLNYINALVPFGSVIINLNTTHTKSTLNYLGVE